MLHLKEKNNSKKGGGKQLTHTRSNNIDELNQNVFLVQTGSGINLLTYFLIGNSDYFSES